MDIDIRPASNEEMGQLGLMASYSYGGAFGDGEDNIAASGNRPEWTLCAFDRRAKDENGCALMATSFAAFPFTIRANGRAMAMAGISVVGTRPEYRRRGLLRQIITRAFAEQRERGQSVAGLWASQAAIYQRYGFARAGMNREYAVDTVDIALMNESSQDTYSVSRHRPIEVLEDIREVYKTFIAKRTGYLHRGKSLWLNAVLSEEGSSATDGPVYVAIAGSKNSPQGYAVYTLRAGQVKHASRPQEIKIRDFSWLNMGAVRSLWQFFARHDLVGRISWSNAPMDDPAQSLMKEPRMLHSRDSDGTWWRIVDVAGALSQRGYDHEKHLVLGIAGDDLAPWNNGNWRIDTPGYPQEEAKVTATNDMPDIQLSIRALAGLYSGMYSARTLANWGQLAGSEQAIARADQLFSTTFAPHCPDHY